MTEKSQPLDQDVIETVKAHHKRRIQKRLVLNMQQEEPLKVDLRAAIDTIMASWWQVKATTIQKCFDMNSGASYTAAASVDVDKGNNTVNVWSDLIKNNCVDEKNTFADIVDEDNDDRAVCEVPPQVTTSWQRCVVTMSLYPRISPTKWVNVWQKFHEKTCSTVATNCTSAALTETSASKCLIVFEDKVISNAVKLQSEMNTMLFFHSPYGFDK